MSSVDASDVPNELYRSFNDERYAIDFTKGIIRFGNLLNYTKMEGDSRRDKLEGLMDTTTPEGERIRGKLGEVTIGKFALCCHKDLEAACSSSHGSHIVKISNPLTLRTQINNALKSQPLKCIGDVEFLRIEYKKGKELGRPFEPLDSARLTYCQKPQYSPDNEINYEQEKEYRFLLLINDPEYVKKESFFLNLGQPIDSVILAPNTY